MDVIINKLVITAGQWKQFGGASYEREFGRLLQELSWIANTSLEGALELLLVELGDQEDVVA